MRIRDWMIGIGMAMAACTGSEPVDVVDNRPPTIERFAAVPTGGLGSMEIRFEWTVSDADGDPLLCTLDPGGGLPPIAVDCGDGAQAQLYAERGVRDAELIVEDPDGAADTDEVAVRTPALPRIVGFEPIWEDHRLLATGPAAWSPDGSRMVTAGSDVVQLWDAAGNLLLTAPLAASLDRLAYRPDGEVLAATGGGGVMLLDADTGALLATPYAGAANDLAWSPDGTRLAIAGPDGLVRIIDAAAGTVLAVFSGHQGSVAAVAWSPDGTRVASTGSDDRLRIWDAASDGIDAEILVYDTGVYATVLAYSPDGTRLLTGTPGNSASGVIVRDATTGATIDWFTCGAGGSPILAAWSRDGQRIAAAMGGYGYETYGGRACFWDAQTGQETVRTGGPNPTRGLAWGPGTSLALVGGEYTRALQIWDAVAAAIAIQVDPLPVTRALALHPDGSRLAVVDRELRLYDGSSGAVIAGLPESASVAQSLAWSPDGQLLAGGAGGDLLLWDGDGAEVRRMDGAAGLVAWDAGGERLASGAPYGGNIELWTVAGGFLRTLAGDPEGIRALAWKATNDSVLAAGGSGYLSAWDPDSGAQIEGADPDMYSLSALAVDADGRVAIAGSGGAALYPSDPFTGGYVRALAWHPLAMIAAAAGELVLWDALAGDEHDAVRLHAGDLVAIAWSADGRILATAAAEGRIAMWRVLYDE